MPFPTIPDRLEPLCLRIQPEFPALCRVSQTAPHWTVNCIAFYNGDFPNSLKHGELSFPTWNPQVSAEYAKLTQQNSGPLVLAHIGMAQWKMGYVEQGPARVQEALDLSIEIKDVFTQTIMEWKLGQIGDYSRNGQMALEHGQRCAQIGEEQSFLWWVAIGTCCQGVGLHQLGRHKEGIELLRDGIARNRASGAGILFVKYPAWLAVALWHDGQRQEAWETLDSAFAVLDRGERYTEAELHRFRGDFHFDEGDLEQAETWYRSSVDIATRQSAKSYELRSTMRLCRIWKQQDKIDQARESLSEVYNWFTEGFDTLDLIEARAMLEEFST
jgi:adenylate cyclase